MLLLFISDVANNMNEIINEIIIDTTIIVLLIHI